MQQLLQPNLAHPRGVQQYWQTNSTNGTNHKWSISDQVERGRVSHEIASCAHECLPVIKQHIPSNVQTSQSTWRPFAIRTGINGCAVSPFQGFSQSCVASCRLISSGKLQRWKRESQHREKEHSEPLGLWAHRTRCKARVSLGYSKAGGSSWKSEPLCCGFAAINSQPKVCDGCRGSVKSRLRVGQWRRSP